MAGIRRAAAGVATSARCRVHSAQEVSEVANPFGSRPNPFGRRTNAFSIQPNPFGSRTNAFSSRPNPFGGLPNPFVASQTRLSPGTRVCRPPNAFGHLQTGSPAGKTGSQQPGTSPGSGVATTVHRALCTVHR